MVGAAASGVEAAQPLLLLPPGVVALASLALAEHPITMGVVYGVAYAVCGGRVNLVWGWFVA